MLTAGYLIERKGIRELIAAVGRLRRDGRRVHLAIIGDGPLRGALAAQAEADGVADAVHFLGRVPHARVLALMARANVFALPSWDEAFGLVYTEAMAQATPVIAGKGEGPEDFIEDGVSGYLAPVRDAGALAGIIAGVLDDPATAAAVGEAGQAAAPRLELGAQRAAHAGRLREGPGLGVLKGPPCASTSSSKQPNSAIRRWCCRSPGPTASTSSATSPPRMSRCSPSTPTREPSVCARGLPPASCAPTRARTRRASSPSSRSWGRACRGAPCSSRRTTSTSGRSPATRNAWRPGTSSRSPAGRRCGVCTTNASSWRPPGASASASRRPSSWTTTTTSPAAPTRSAFRRSSSRSTRWPSRSASAGTCSRSARATSSCASTTRCATAAR